MNSKSIEKACIKYNNKLYTGFDHGECFKKLTEDNTIINKIEEGFVDNNGNFVDRKQAMIIAKEAGQLRFDLNKQTLISEDLYLDWLNKQKQQIIKMMYQLEEKDKEIRNLKEQFDIFTLKNAFKYQNCIKKSEMQFAIDYAVEQLEKVKEEFTSEVWDMYDTPDLLEQICEFRNKQIQYIDQQINQLKGINKNE